MRRRVDATLCVCLLGGLLAASQELAVLGQDGAPTALSTNAAARLADSDQSWLAQRSRKLLADDAIVVSSIEELVNAGKNAVQAVTNVVLAPNRQYYFESDNYLLTINSNTTFRLNCQGMIISACQQCSMISLQPGSRLETLNCNVAATNLFAALTQINPNASANTQALQAEFVSNQCTFKTSCNFVTALPILVASGEKTGSFMNVKEKNESSITISSGEIGLGSGRVLLVTDSLAYCDPNEGPEGPPVDVPAPADKKSLAIWAKAIIGVSVAVVVVALIAMAVLCVRQRRLSTEEPLFQNNSLTDKPSEADTSELDDMVLDPRLVDHQKGRVHGSAVNSDQSNGTQIPIVSVDPCSEIQWPANMQWKEDLEVHGLIAQGGYGTVHRGTWRGLPVAVKTVVIQRVATDDPYFDRMASEASIAYNLVHKNIVATYSHEFRQLDDMPGVCSGKLYLIQALCNGGSLATFIQSGRLRNKQGSIRWNAVLSMLCDIANGLEHVHSKRIVHGDLNPNNILLHMSRESEEFGAGGPDAVAARASVALSNGTCRALITDFGLSTRMNPGVTHVSNMTQGTPFYAAPELFQKRHMQPASDIYSYGVVMWELAHGCAPFVARKGILERHKHFPKFEKEAPLTFVLLAVACMSNNPADRPSCREVLDVLSDLRKEMAKGSYTCYSGEVRPLSSASCANYENRPSTSSEAATSATSSGVKVNTSRARVESFDRPVTPMHAHMHNGVVRIDEDHSSSSSDRQISPPTHHATHGGNAPAGIGRHGGRFAAVSGSRFYTANAVEAVPGLGHHDPALASGAASPGSEKEDKTVDTFISCASDKSVSRPDSSDVGDVQRAETGMSRVQTFEIVGPMFHDARGSTNAPPHALQDGHLKFTPSRPATYEFHADPGHT